MAVRLSLCLVLVGAAAAAARELTNDEYFSLPKLFHLDDYERCLSRSGGVYCQGTFHVTPYGTSSIYDLINAYSDDVHFDHTLLHRGYCVSTRCPDSLHSLSSYNVSRSSRSPARRFARCAALWGKQRNLKLRLQKLDYCISHEEYTLRSWDLGASKLIFLGVVGAILFMNILGTVLGSQPSTEDGSDNNVLAAWSVRDNWRLLTRASDDEGQAALAPLQGFRMVTLVCVTFAHVIIVMATGYIDNSHTFEKVSQGPLGVFVTIGAVVVQTYILLSSFMACYHLLLKCCDHPPSFTVIPNMILRRIIRMSPTTMLIVSFSSTWWEHAGDGPQWRALVLPESRVCRRKFWWHLLFVNNLVEPREFCLCPTWFVAADMQLYIITIALTLFVARYRAHAMKILLALLLIVTVALSVLAYVTQWKSFVFANYPENARTTGRQLPHFPWFISPGGGIQASLIGMMLAFLQVRIRDQGGFNIHQHKWLAYAYHASLPLGVSWTQAGFLLKSNETSALTAVFFGLERPLLLMFSALAVFGSINIECMARRVMSWRVWAVAARASLPYMLVHWLLLLSLAGARVQPLHYSFVSHCLETATALSAGMLLSVTIAVLAELPLQRTLAGVLLSPALRAARG